MTEDTKAILAAISQTEALIYTSKTDIITEINVDIQPVVLGQTNVTALINKGFEETKNSINNLAQKLESIEKEQQGSRVDIVHRLEEILSILKKN